MKLTLISFAALALAGELSPFSQRSVDLLLAHCQSLDLAQLSPGRKS